MRRIRFRHGRVSKVVEKDVEDVATSFFISNIPDECNDLYMWKVFQKLGCLCFSKEGSSWVEVWLCWVHYDP